MVSFPNAQNNPLGAIPTYQGGVGTTPSTSLKAVTATGAGTPVAFNSALSKIGMQVSFTGSPTAVIVNLNGTLDGKNYFNLAQFKSGGGGTNSSGDIVFTSNTPVIGALANLTTLTGGTSPTVTATIIGAP